MPLQSFKFQLPDQLQPPIKIRRNVSLKYAAIPKKLQKICENVVDDLSLPEAFYWELSKMLEGAQKLNVTCDMALFEAVLICFLNLIFNHYKLNFLCNHITGQNMVRIRASDLVKMNIKDFEVIKKITSKLRCIYEIESVQPLRSISLPPRYPDTHYKMFRTYTGPKYELCTRSELWRMMKVLRVLDKSHDVPGNNHFDKLEQKLRHEPENRAELIGLIRRFQLYAVSGTQSRETHIVRN